MARESETVSMSPRSRSTKQWRRGLIHRGAKSDCDATSVGCETCETSSLDPNGIGFERAGHAYDHLAICAPIADRRTRHGLPGTGSSPRPPTAVIGVTVRGGVIGASISADSAGMRNTILVSACDAIDSTLRPVTIAVPLGVCSRIDDVISPTFFVGLRRYFFAQYKCDRVADQECQQSDHQAKSQTCCTDRGCADHRSPPR